MAITTRDTGADEGHDAFYGDVPAEKKSKFALPRRKEKAQEADWLDDVEEIPRTDLPDGQRLARRAKWTKWYLIGCAFMTPLLLAMTLVAVTKPTPEIPKPKPVEAITRERAEGMVAVQNWLASPESPVARGRVIGWQGSKVLPKAKPKKTTGGTPDEDPVTLTAVRFMVATTPKASKDGEFVQVSAYASNLYVAEVLVAQAKSGAVTVVGEPSLTPMAPSVAQAVQSAARWPSLPESASPSEQVETSIRSWADALTSGSPQALRSAINDSDSQHAYVPFTGITLKEVQVGASAARKMTGGETPVPTEIVVAVKVTMTDNPTCKECDKAVAEYDVLIVGADSVNPRVVAWGAAGTGATLRPYENAVKATASLNAALEGMEREAAAAEQQSATADPEQSGDETPAPKPKKSPGPEPAQEGN